MKILSLGINDVTKPLDGLPEYERLFGEYFSKKNQVMMLNIVPKACEETQVEMKLNDKWTQILIHVPDFFGNMGSDVWKYPDIFNAFYQLGKWKPDVIILQDWFFAPVIAAIKGLTIPVIYICHLFQNALNPLMGEVNALAELSEIKGMDELSDMIIANSITTGNDIAEVLPHVKPKIITSQLGVDKTQYQPMPNLESNVILYLGRLDPMKGINLFLEEVEENIEALEGYKILIAGKGAYLNEVMELHFKYPDIVEYIGCVYGDEKKEIMAAAKYMVFPSLYEPWGLSLNQGLACGKICVATPIGGHLEQIKHLSNGILTKDSMILSILDIEGNENLQHNIIDQAIKTARDIEPHFKEVMEVINAVKRT